MNCNLRKNSSRVRTRKQSLARWKNMPRCCCCPTKQCLLIREYWPALAFQTLHSPLARKQQSDRGEAGNTAVKEPHNSRVHLFAGNSLRAKSSQHVAGVKSRCALGKQPGNLSHAHVLCDSSGWCHFRRIFQETCRPKRLANGEYDEISY